MVVRDFSILSRKSGHFLTESGNNDGESMSFTVSDNFLLLFANLNFWEILPHSYFASFVLYIQNTELHSMNIDMD